MKCRRHEIQQDIKIDKLTSKNMTLIINKIIGNTLFQIELMITQRLIKHVKHKHRFVFQCYKQEKSENQFKKFAIKSSRTTCKR